MFLPNFKPLRNKDFILDFYLENHNNIWAPFGLLNTDFIVNANFNKEKLYQLIRLSLDAFIKTSKKQTNLGNKAEYLYFINIPFHKIDNNNSLNLFDKNV